MPKCHSNQEKISKGTRENGDQSKTTKSNQSCLFVTISSQTFQRVTIRAEKVRIANKLLCFEGKQYFFRRTKFAEIMTKREFDCSC